MFDFRFNYSEDDIYPVFDVEKISFQSENGWEEVSGDDIMSTCIPLDDIMHLYNSDGKFIVSCKGIRSIEIRKKQ